MKMKSFIYKTIHQQDIINLEYTIKQFDLAKDLVSLLSNQNILLVSKNEIFLNLLTNKVYPNRFVFKAISHFRRMKTKMLSKRLK